MTFWRARHHRPTRPVEPRPSDSKLRRDGKDEAIRAAISVGGDTDTIAAMAAQIVGATGVEPPADLVSKIPGAPEARRVFAATAALLR